MTGHTPGPWEVEHGRINDGGIVIAHYSPDNGSETATIKSYVAELFPSTLCDEHGSIEANARLIASSPDLLAALEDAVIMLAEYHKVSPEIDPANAEHLDACDMGAIGDQGGCAHCHAVKKARAAITKARGEGR